MITEEVIYFYKLPSNLALGRTFFLKVWTSSAWSRAGHKSPCVFGNVLQGTIVKVSEEIYELFRYHLRRTPLI